MNRNENEQLKNQKAKGKQPTTVLFYKILMIFKPISWFFWFMTFKCLGLAILTLAIVPDDFARLLGSKILFWLVNGAGKPRKIQGEKISAIYQVSPFFYGVTFLISTSLFNLKWKKMWLWRPFWLITCLLGLPEGTARIKFVGWISHHS